MKAVYLDCFAGISGNMLLGALLDVGLPEKELRRALGKLPVDDYELIIKRVVKGGISATYVDTVLEHHHHHHRHLPDIYDIINRADLPEPVKDKSKQVFSRLAEAEAKVHGSAIDKVHFHEVGATDAIIDIVGGIFGLYYLGVEQIYVSRLHVGTGFVQGSHGIMPVPAPATAELLRGIPYYSGDIAKELVTPTGAAIVAVLGDGFGAMPPGFVCHRIGYGAGTWDLPIPNVLRLQLGKICGDGNREMCVIETNIDDLNPQIFGYVSDKLFAAGAVDVWFTPVTMKKGRPATELSVLAPVEILDTIVDILFTETSTLGVRYTLVDRIIAEREWLTVELPWGKVQVKVGRRGNKVCNLAPEYEDCRRLAEEHKVPLKTVQQTAICQAMAIAGQGS